MVDFAAANAVIFATFGVAATYRAAGAGDGLAVTIIRDRPTADAVAFGTTLRAHAQIIHVQVAEVAVLAKGDSFTIGAEILTVAGAPRLDGLRTMWTAEC